VEGDQQEEERESTTPAMKSCMRPFMKLLWSSSAAVTPPTLTSMDEPSTAAGIVLPRRRLTGPRWPDPGASSSESPWSGPVLGGVDPHG